MIEIEPDPPKLKELIYSQKLKVNIWGSGTSGTGDYPERELAICKRLQIRDAINEKFPKATVHNTERGDQTRSTQEVRQAKESDLVILVDFRGESTELDLDSYVPLDPEFLGKVHAILPNRYVDSTCATDAVFGFIEKGCVNGFTDEEFRSCNVRAKALEATETIALRRLMDRINQNWLLTSPKPRMPGYDA